MCRSPASSLRVALLGATAVVFGCGAPSALQPADPPSADADPSPPGVDADGDGASPPEDCDDADATVFPGAPETCNGVDDDCDAFVDEEAVGASWFYYDHDGDGFGDSAEPAPLCREAPHWATVGGDCDDDDATVFPGALESCDGVDQDCDGVPDDGGPWYADHDGDGYGDPAEPAAACTAPNSHVAAGTDCDDTRADVHPEAADVTCDGVDQACAGVPDAGTWYHDGDGDGFGSPNGIDQPCLATSVRNADDCDDSNHARSPDAAELPNGADDDCDTRVDEHTGALPCAALGAFDRYVPDDAPTIQAAIEASAPGDRVCVRAGVYPEAIDFGGRDVYVYGEGGAAATVIDATGLAAPAVRFASGESSAATLVGFTVRGGAGELEADRVEDTSELDYCSGTTAPVYYSLWCGGGVYVAHASPTLEDLIVEGSALPTHTSRTGYDDIGVAEYVEIGLGGGVCLRSAGSSLTEVDVVGGEAWEGGGGFVDADSAVTWSQGWFAENEANHGGALYVDGGSLALTNAVTDANTAATGAALYAVGGSVSLENVTAYDDEAGAEGAAVVTYDTALRLDNVLAADFTGAVGVHVYGYGIPVDLAYTLVYSPTAAPWLLETGEPATSPVGAGGNLSAPPKLTAAAANLDAADDDLTLGPDSPARDAGDPALLDADGSPSDLGAWGGPAGMVP